MLRRQSARNRVKALTWNEPPRKLAPQLAQGGFASFFDPDVPRFAKSFVPSHLFRPAWFAIGYVHQDLQMMT